MKECSHSLGKDASSSSPSYNKLRFGQQRLAKLLAKDSDIMKKIIFIQFMLLPHLEIIQNELSIAQSLLKKDTNFFKVLRA